MFQVHSNDIKRLSIEALVYLIQYQINSTVELAAITSSSSSLKIYFLINY